MPLSLVFPHGTSGKEPALWEMEEMQVPSLEDPLEEGMATHSSILAWRIPWTEESGWLTVHRVAQSWTQLSDLAQRHTHSLIFGCNRLWVLVTLTQLPWIFTQKLYAGYSSLVLSPFQLRSLGPS